MKNLLTDVLVPRYELPEGYDSWGIKSVHPDLTTRNGYRWPFPGNVAYSPGPLLDHNESCPRRVGDGLCVALDWEGMASSDINASTLLLVAYRSDEARGDQPGKLRVPEAYVVDVIDGVELVRRHGAGAYLYKANLGRMEIYAADLSDADLSTTRLNGSYLVGSNLANANLTGAVCIGANMSSTIMYNTNLSYADMTGASLLNSTIKDAWMVGSIWYRADMRGVKGLSKGQLDYVKEQGAIID